MYDNNENQFSVIDWKLEHVKNKLSAFNKKAEKMGFPCAYLSIVGEYKATVEMNGFEFSALFYIVKITGEILKINGWRFLGALDHATVPGSVIVKALPGVELPEQFRHADNNCEHCNKKIDRKNTFVMKNESGEFKRVGSSCIKDFLGHNPGDIAAYAGSFNAFIDELGDHDEPLAGGNTDELLADIHDVLTVTNLIIRNFGWVSKAKADETWPPIMPTSSIVKEFFFGAHTEARKLRENLQREQIDREAASEALAWLETQEASSDYMHNVKTIANHGDVKAGAFGLACSIMACYQKHVEKMNSEKVEKKNEHFGQLKKREEFSLTLIKKRFIDSYYGGTYQHMFYDDQGRLAVWWASNDSEFNEGQTIKAKATVKEHANYNGEKQTILTRVAII